MSWKDCRARGLVKDVRVDHARIASLRESSERRVRTTERIELDETTCSVLVTLWYDALRERLEALAMRSGYHVYNHACYESFLREILAERVMAKRFATLRTIRNGINYYGAHLSPADAERHIERARRLIEQVDGRFEE